MAKFVADDIRPYHLVDGNGFKSFCYELMRFGQQHPQATKNDLHSVLPCRNSVKNGVAEIAKESRKFIALELQKALETGAITIILDGWTDNHQHQSYLGVIAILMYEEGDGQIITKKYTLSVNNIIELRKTKRVISAHLFEVLDLYGISKQTAVHKIVVVHDRGANIK